MRKNEIAIVIPCFNESRTILKVYKKAKNFGKVLIVDDASTDETKKILKKKKIKFLDNKKNLGYESSLVNGFKYVFKKWKNIKYIATLDADGELLSEYLNKLSKKLLKENLDIVIGSRKKLNRITEKILKIIFNIKYNINDPISGLKLYRKKVLQETINLSSSSLFLVDIIIFAYFNKFAISNIDVPVKKRKDEPRVGNIFSTNLKILKIIFYSIFPKKN